MPAPRSSNGGTGQTEFEFVRVSVVRPAIEKLDRWRVVIEIDRATSHGLQCDHTKAVKV